MRKAMIWVCFFQLILAGAAWPQANRATITGTVTDSSGAPMAGIEVVVKNLGTSVLTTASTNEDGIYSIPNLFPGPYSVEFRKDGFKAVKYPSVTLESTQVAQLNASLQVGAVTENIMVTADAPVLDHENAAIGTNMKGDVVTDLPLSIYGGGRFAENFAVAITPGYSPISSPYGAVINGGQWFTKDYTVDGTSATASIQGDSLETGPGMESVQEVQAQTSGLDAQSGITSGGVISFNLKSGTNKFHGSAFAYGHNELLDANTWRNNLNGLRKTKARAWDYGGSLGGPIIKQKTFFFGTFERYVQHDFTLNGGGGATVPTAAMLGGDFNALLGAVLCKQTDGSYTPRCDTTQGDTPVNIKNNAGQTLPLQQGMIFDPQTGNQFTSNAIPSNRFSSVAQKIIPLFQKYYTPNGGIKNNNFLPSQNVPVQTPNEAVVKLDHNLTTNDRLSGSWIYNHRPTLKNDSGGIWSAGSLDGGPLSEVRNQLIRSHQWRVSESHVFSPNVLNVFNATYNWYWNGSVPASTGTNWNSQLGFGNTGADNFPAIGFGNAVNGISTTNIGNTWQGYYTAGTLILGDSVTWTHGRHSFTYGGNFRAYEINGHDGSGAISFNFNNNPTGVPAAGYNDQVGFGFASFLLGNVQNASETTPSDLYGRRKAISLFAQDSWKLTPKLTVNLGLRWMYTGRFHEKYGHWANYDLTAIDPTTGLPGTLVFAKNGSDSFEKKEYWTDFGPQLGIAYSPWQKWVFRGGFSMLYVPLGTPYFHGVPFGFAPGFKGNNSVNAPFDWDSGYPGVFKPGSKNVDVTQLFSPGVVSISPHALTGAFTNNINAGVQYQVTPTMRVEAAYVGSRGHHLPDQSLAFNEPSAKQFFGFINQGIPYNPYSFDLCSPADAAKFGIKYPYPGFCGSLYAAIAPFPQLANAMDQNYYPQLFYVGLPLAKTYYDSMIVDVVKRAGSGLTMDLSYTLSRTEGDTYTAFQENFSDYTPVQDLSNLNEAAHTLTNYDQKHVVKGFVSYELPFGRGRRWLSGHGRVANAFVGGWTVAGIVLYASGQPFNAGVSNPYYAGWDQIYPNYNLSGFNGPIFQASQYVQQPRNSPKPQTTYYYLPSSVATAPANGQLGTGPLRISALRCPGISNENASVLKYFSMGSDGQYKLSIRGEFYNLFNRHTYGIEGCGGTISRIVTGNPGLGQITGVNSSPRTGQFAVRFTF